MSELVCTDCGVEYSEIDGDGEEHTWVEARADQDSVQHTEQEILAELAVQGQRRHVLFELAARGERFTGVRFVAEELGVRDESLSKQVEAFISEVDSHSQEYDVDERLSEWEKKYGDTADLFLAE